MIKLETHCHTKGVSPCADCDDDIMVKKYADAGYGGVVITNHLSEYSYSRLTGDSHKEKTDSYFNGYHNVREKLIKAGLKVFWGVEVRAYYKGGEFAEYILYGLDEKDMYDNPPFYTFTQRELFLFAEKKNAFMYEAHPFRTKVTCGDPALMHGAEAFNGHSGHFNYNALADDFCERNSLIKMSGTDHHHEYQPLTAGIYIPENVNDEKSLTDFLFKNDFRLFRNAAGYERALRENKEKLL